MKRYCGSEQSGRSMVEMLGVLAIIGVLSVGGIAGYSKAMAKFKINQALEQISTLIVNIRTVFANQTNFAALNNQVASNLGLVSAEMEAANNALVNPFGGAVVINGNNNISGAANGTVFTVSYAGLDRNACQTIALADWGASASSGLVALQVGNTTFTWGGANNSLPVDIASAANSCQDNNNQITWEYR